MKTDISRRKILQAGTSAAALGTTLGTALLGMPLKTFGNTARVVIVGGGAGGTIAARTMKRISPRTDIVLIESDNSYYTCFMSNEVLGGYRSVESIRFDYRQLQREGIQVVNDRVTSIQPTGKSVTTAQNHSFSYDRLIVCPGISFRRGSIEGYDNKAARIMPHAWKAGYQTTLLRDQLLAMPNNGCVIIAAPPGPYRCNPAPYERACQIAAYLKAHHARGKILLLDAKDDFTQRPLFQQVWNQLYPGMIDWIPGGDTAGGVVRVNTDTMTAFTEFDEFRADVINIIPPQQAGKIAQTSGLTDHTGWCPVQLDTFESVLERDIYIIGDAALVPGMPKSAHAAATQAKTCATAVLSTLLESSDFYAEYASECYSQAAPDYAFSISASYQLASDHSKLLQKSGATTALNAPRSVYSNESRKAQHWYQNITMQMFG